MQNADNNPGFEAGLRQPLTQEERARLRAEIRRNPALKEALAEDVALNACLRQLPARPLSSNFTHQVLCAIQQNPHPAQQPHPLFQWLAWPWKYHGMARVTVVGVGLLCIGLCIHVYQDHSRARFARSVVELGRVSNALNPEVLKDFEAIYRLKQVPVAVDEELLAALQ
jgi:anti-sigma factor RsiW